MHLKTDKVDLKKKPPWKNFFLHIFSIHSSSRYEKQFRMLQRLFWLFQCSKNQLCKGFTTWPGSTQYIVHPVESCQRWLARQNPCQLSPWVNNPNFFARSPQTPSLAWLAKDTKVNRFEFNFTWFSLTDWVYVLSDARSWLFQHSNYTHRFKY